MDKFEDQGACGLTWLNTVEWFSSEGKATYYQIGRNLREYT